MAHVPVGLQAVAAGKHVHSEKPLGITVAEARKLVDAAKAKGVRIGCAPDTFLGGAHQTCAQAHRRRRHRQARGGHGLLGRRRP